MKKILFLFLIVLFLSFPVKVGAASVVPTQKTVTTTAYYSPEKGQKEYFHGSYEQDFLVNGPGFQMASGAAPYEGAVAGPSTLAFGTLIYVDGFGWAVVEDRGAAIVVQGERNQANDRLDIWMGRGDFGRKKAVNWGRTSKQATIFSTRWLQVPSGKLTKELDLNDSSQEVILLQKVLWALGFYDGAFSKAYDSKTQEAVLAFQKWKGIVVDSKQNGAGRVGPGTLKRLNNFLGVFQDLQFKKSQANKDYNPQAQARKMQADFYTQDLSYGDMNYSVYMLQNKLEKLGYFKHDRKTYTYGDVTKGAVLAYQLEKGIVKSEKDKGAGVFGATTRSKLKSDLESLAMR